MEDSMHQFEKHIEGCDPVVITADSRVTMGEFVEIVHNTVGDYNIGGFIKSLEAYSEDWELCEDLGKHFIRQVTDFLSGKHGGEDPEWKGEYLLFLKEQISKLEGEDE